MTFTALEISFYAAFVFFAMLSLALFSYGCGVKEGRIAGVREMLSNQLRAHAEHEAAKRAWFQK